jgi:hypothetical protein
VAPLAAEGEPAEADPGHVVARRLEHQDALGEPIIERGDEPGQCFRTDPLREQGLRQPANLLGGAAQRREVVGEMDSRRDFAHGHALEREQAALRDDAYQPARLADQHVTDAVLRHEPRGVVQRGRRRQMNRVRRHELAQRPRHVERAVGRVPHEIPFGEDPLRRPVGGDGHDRADALLEHLAQRRTQRGVDRTGYRVALDRRRQRPHERTIRDRLGAVRTAKRVARLLEQAVHVPGSVVPELRAGAHQLLDRFALDLVAEDVLDRLVYAGRRARAEQRIQRKHLSRAVLVLHVVVGRVGRARVHDAALDEEQLRHDPLRRVGDEGALFVVREPQVSGDKAQRALVHLVERHIPAQELERRALELGWSG